MNPFPGPRSVLVLDNCSIHHADTVRELIEEQGGEYLSILCTAGNTKLIVAKGGILKYLPAYSPDFNPIEQAFSIMKAHLRRNCRDTSLFAMDRAISSIGADFAASFYRASGYM